MRIALTTGIFLAAIIFLIAVILKRRRLKREKEERAFAIEQIQSWIGERIFYLIIDEGLPPKWRHMVMNEFMDQKTWYRMMINFGDDTIMWVLAPVWQVLEILALRSHDQIGDYMRDYARTTDPPEFYQATPLSLQWAVSQGLPEATIQKCEIHRTTRDSPRLEGIMEKLKAFDQLVEAECKAERKAA